MMHGKKKRIIKVVYDWINTRVLMLTQVLKSQCIYACIPTLMWPTEAETIVMATINLVRCPVED